MGKGFGIAALVLAILAIFVPLYGVVVSAIAVLLAVTAVFGGDRIFSTAVAIICVVNALFLSPSFWIFVVANSHNSPQVITYTVIGYCLLPFAAMAAIAAYQKGGFGSAPVFKHFDEWGHSTASTANATASSTHSGSRTSRPGKQSASAEWSYDRRKWLALIRFDDEIRGAATKVRAYGQRWEDELARTYLQVNDKDSLEKIVSTILARAQRS